MTLKTSYKNLYFQESKRNIFLTVIGVLGIFLALPFYFIQQVVTFGTDYGVAMKFASDNLLVRRTERLYSVTYGNKFILVVLTLLAVLNGIVLFSYLFSKKKQDFYFAQPVKRSALFWISYLQGIVSGILPYILNLILVFILAAVNHCLSGNFAIVLLLTSAMNMLLYLTTFSLTVLACTLTGRLFYALLGTGVFLCYGPCLYSALNSFFMGNLASLNIVANKVYLLSPFTIVTRLLFVGDYYYDYEYMEKVRVTTYPLSDIIAMILIVAVGLVASRLYFVRRSAGETGKTIVFKKAKKVIKGFLIVATVLLTSTAFPVIYNVSTLKCSIIGICVGLVFSIYLYDTLLELSWKACFCNWKEQWIFAVIAIAVFAGIYGYKENHRYHGFDDIPQYYTVEEALSDGCMVLDESDYTSLGQESTRIYTDNITIYNEVKGLEALEKFVEDVNAGKEAKLRIFLYGYGEERYYDWFYRNGKIERYCNYNQFYCEDEYSSIVKLSGKLGDDMKALTCFVLTNEKNYTMEQFRTDMTTEEAVTNKFYCIFSFEKK